MSFKCPNCKEDFALDSDKLETHLKENFICGRAAARKMIDRFNETPEDMKKRHDEEQKPAEFEHAKDVTGFRFLS